MSKPGSFAAGAIPGEEEYLELSDFLGAQRTKYDELRTTYREKQRILKALEAECEHLARITHLNDTSTDEFRDKSLALNKQLDEIRGRTEDAAHRTAVYKHMQSRLENDQLLLDRQLERLGHLKKEAAREHHHVKQMMHNQKMRRNQLEKKRRELEIAARANKKKRDKRLEEAQEALKEQVRMQTRRETREKKRRQIALEVAGDLGEEEEQRLKKQFVTKQMYSTFLAGKLEKNVARSSALQQGFQKIKNATGLSNVDDILQKYLTRDETYESLVKAAKETEKQIEAAQAEQKVLQNALESIQLQGVAGQGNRTLYREIDQYDAELSEARKQCNEFKDRSVKASMTLEDVRQCVVKLARKLDMPSDTKELPAPELLPGMLKDIEGKVRDIVESLSDFVGEASSIGGSSGNPRFISGSAAARANDKGGKDADDSGPEGKGASGQSAERAVPRQKPTARSETKSNGGSGKSLTPSVIGSRARDLLYDSLMAVEPDTSSRNIRVLSKALAAEQEKSFVYSGSVVTANKGHSAKKSTLDAAKANKDKKTKGISDEDDEDDEDDEGEVIDRKGLKGLGAMLVEAHQQKLRKAEARAIALAAAEEKNEGGKKKRRSKRLTRGKPAPSTADTRRLEMLLGKDNAAKVQSSGEHFKSDGRRQPTRPTSGSSQGSSKRRSSLSSMA